MVEIELTPIEQEIVKMVSVARFEHARKNKYKATIYNGTPAMKNETDSYGAEVAYCRLMNVYPDFVIEKTPWFDATLRDGSKVDVKQTKYKGGKLMAKHKPREGIPDLYALMIGVFPSYRYVGELRGEELLTEDRIDTSLANPAYTARQGELTWREPEQKDFEF